MQQCLQRPPSATVALNASGGWGCGTFMHSGEWFQFQWPKAWEQVHVTAKELLSIVVDCAVWDHMWRGCSIKCLCDNATVVAIVKSGTSKDALVMYLMRCLFLFTAHHQLVLLPKHLPGIKNVPTDHLSRDALFCFLQLMPGAMKEPTVLPKKLMEALVAQRIDWESVSWRAVLRSSLPMV